VPFKTIKIKIIKMTNVKDLLNHWENGKATFKRDGFSYDEPYPLKNCTLKFNEATNEYFVFRGQTTYGIKDITLIYGTEDEIKLREHPILGVSCPICGSVFSVQALHTQFFNENDNEENARILKELMEYAMQGLDIKIYNGKDYNFHYCEHVKGRSR
jgi:hypothetical protein